MIKLWDQYGFEIILGLAFLFIILYALYRNGKGGTWSNSFFYAGDMNNLLSVPEHKNQQGKDSKGEILCRRILESKFGKSFKKARPNFLRNPVTGGDFNLELDCYNEELGLALEYNGAQHYKYIPYFHKNKEAFLNQKYRDEMKKSKCKENGISLIEVPYTVRLEELDGYIEKELYKIIFRRGVNGHLSHLVR